MSECQDLSGQVVVVTGASSGLGRQVAIEFAGAGCKVVLAARREDDSEGTAELCRAAGGEALSLPADVTVEADVQRLVSETLAAYRQIDVWINNAGVTLLARLACRRRHTAGCSSHSLQISTYSCA